MVGGVRNPITGRGDKPDVENDDYIIESKARSSIPKWLKKAVEQAVRAAENDAQHRVPMVMLHEKGAQYDDDLVVMRYRDLSRILERELYAIGIEEGSYSPSVAKMAHTTPEQRQSEREARRQFLRDFFDRQFEARADMCDCIVRGYANRVGKDEQDLTQEEIDEILLSPFMQELDKLEEIEDEEIFTQMTILKLTRAFRQGDIDFATYRECLRILKDTMKVEWENVIANLNIPTTV